MSDSLRLEKLLRLKPMTAAEIARALKCSKPTAYAQIERLMGEGVDVITTQPTGKRKTGPVPVLYSVR